MTLIERLIDRDLNSVAIPKIRCPGDYGMVGVGPMPCKNGEKCDEDVCEKCWNREYSASESQEGGMLLETWELGPGRLAQFFAFLREKEKARGLADGEEGKE